MLVETITYNDYDGNERTETFRFNLTQAEITELEMSVNGGLTSLLQTLVSSKDGPEIMKTFKKILLAAYGEKSLDGKRFIKSEEISKAFSETEAYNIIFMRLLTDEDYATKFISNLNTTNPIIGNVKEISTIKE